MVRDTRTEDNMPAANMSSSALTSGTCSTSDRVISSQSGHPVQLGGCLYEENTARGSDGKAVVDGTTMGLGDLINLLRSELVQLMKYDEGLLRQLQCLGVSISALSAAVQERRSRGVRGRCRFASTSTVSDLDSIDVKSPNAVSPIPVTTCATNDASRHILSDVKTDDVIRDSGLSDNQRSVLKIGNRVVTPCARVLSWIGDSDFENDANEHDRYINREVKRQPKYLSRKRSRTCAESDIRKRRSIAKHRERLENDDGSLDTLQFLLRNEQLLQLVRSQSLSDVRKSADDTMFRSESYSSLYSHERTSPRVMDSDPVFVCTRRFSVSWRPFTFLDSLDSYLMGHVGSRLRFQPRPRLHRQSNVSESFDAHSAKIFLSQTELRSTSGLPVNEAPPKEDIVLSDATSTKCSNTSSTFIYSNNGSLPTENNNAVNRIGNASVPVLHKSDSGYDDSFEESDRESQTSTERTAKVATSKRERREPVPVSENSLKASVESCRNFKVRSNIVERPDNGLELASEFRKQEPTCIGRDLPSLNHTSVEQCENDNNSITETDAQIESDKIKHIDSSAVCSEIHKTRAVCSTAEPTEIVVAKQTDNEIFTILEQSSSKETPEEEHYLDIHDGMITCRIMSPNLERQISEQHKQDSKEGEEFEYLTIVDGRVVFRPRDRGTELDLEESYCIQRLFEECNYNGDPGEWETHGIQRLFEESTYYFNDSPEESDSYGIQNLFEECSYHDSSKKWDSRAVQDLFEKCNHNGTSEHRDLCGTQSLADKCNYNGSSGGSDSHQGIQGLFGDRGDNHSHDESDFIDSVRYFFEGFEKLYEKQLSESRCDTWIEDSVLLFEDELATTSA